MRSTESKDLRLLLQSQKRHCFPIAHDRSQTSNPQSSRAEIAAATAVERSAVAFRVISESPTTRPRSGTALTRSRLSNTEMGGVEHFFLAQFGEGNRDGVGLFAKAGYPSQLIRYLFMPSRSLHWIVIISPEVAAEINNGNGRARFALLIRHGAPLELTVVVGREFVIRRKSITIRHTTCHSSFDHNSDPCQLSFSPSRDN